MVAFLYTLFVNDYKYEKKEGREMGKPRIIVAQNKRGAITRLSFNDDPSKMNWVIDPAYLKQMGYDDQDKLFGEFTITIDGRDYHSTDFTPKVQQGEKTSEVEFAFANILLTEIYSIKGNYLEWGISISNQSNSMIQIDNLGMWASLAYVMFRDPNVYRNAEQSAAVFPSISPSYTKLAVMRRMGGLRNLGLYQLGGVVRSVGTYCEYTNRFFENVSPSLDGLLFHQLILAGGYPKGEYNDWIYSRDGIKLRPGDQREWRFALAEFDDQADFYRVGKQHFNHPQIKFKPMVVLNQPQTITIESQQPVKRAVLMNGPADDLTRTDVTGQLNNGQLRLIAHHPGEHQLKVEFADGSEDMVVYNVMTSVNDLLEKRADYLCRHSYNGKKGKVPYSFSPLSNQGESLGKLNFILQECIMDTDMGDRAKKIQQVEASAVNYVRRKWFINGNFLKPAKLYGNFYRVMDLEYIAHLYYLLSKCPAEILRLNSPAEYLKWAAQVFDVRVNPALHDNQRGKEEAQMLGVYYLYIDELLKDVKAGELSKEYAEIKSSWQSAIKRVADQSNNLKAAVTEHFFDNAGFGPAAGALAVNGDLIAARRYAKLLKANIGYGNDFRAQAPDRWWEALSYMMHSLWGGITAAAAQVAGEKLGDPQLVAAGYRATVAMFYLYDSNATAADRLLKPGEAASTYSIAGPNLNRPDLSRNRFGQSVFASDGGIFSRLFPDGYTGEDDWDMGEELVAYLNGFGQTTYLYLDDHDCWQAINGHVTVDGYVISAAPYLHKYVDLTNHRKIVTTQRKIKLEG